MEPAQPNATRNQSELAAELAQLRETAGAVTERFETSARQFRETGAPPSLEFLEELRSYRNRMDRLARALEPSDELRRSAGPIGSLTLDELQRRLEARRRSEIAEEIRARLAQLEHVGESEFGPLAKCLELATRLCDLSHGLTDDTAAEQFELLEQRRHPLNAILRLAADSHELTDTEWSECCENVAAAFGQPLATALSRGRIRPASETRTNPKSAADFPENKSDLRPKESTDPVANLALEIFSDASALTAMTRSSTSASVIPSNPPTASIVAAALAPSNGAISNKQSPTPFEPFQTQEPDRQTTDDAGSIFDATVAKKSTIDRSTAAELAAALSRRATPDVRATTQFAHPALTAGRPATASPSPLINEVPLTVEKTPRRPTEDPACRSLRISQHIIRLLLDDRLPLALQLTRCLETRPEPATWMPPAWLLRAIILGRHLSYARGQVTCQLDDELRNFRPELLTEGTSEQQMVMGFLLRAAAVPAALLAGSAPASSILRTFKIDPGFSQLYNYCSRIGTYGNRLAGTLAEMFRPAGTIAGVSELEDVALDAKQWLQNTARRLMSYSRSSPLFVHAHWTVVPGSAMRHPESTQVWCLWQQTLLTAKRLLAPVCQGLDGERNSVRKEIVRLTSRLRIAKADSVASSGNQFLSNDRDLQLPLEMQATLIEAINLANRWLQLCDQAGPGGASPIPPESLELRSEVLSRTPAVMQELVQHRRPTATPLLQAAIACCQSSVRYIQSVFESRISLPAVEPDPRQILNAELLRFPGLELNDQWLPENDPAAVEFELLSRVEGKELNWRQSFDVHAQAGNHVATGRLLELHVWENPTEYESLMALRNAQIREAQSILAAEIDQLTNQFRRVAEAAGSSPAYRAASIQRLDVLRHELPHALDFRAFRRRLELLKSNGHQWIAISPATAGLTGRISRTPADIDRGQPADQFATSEYTRNEFSMAHQPSSDSYPDIRPEPGTLSFSDDGQVPPQLILSSADIYSGE